MITVDEIEAEFKRLAVESIGKSFRKKYYDEEMTAEPMPFNDSIKMANFVCVELIEELIKSWDKLQAAK
jgi:hypothetical protein